MVMLKIRIFGIIMAIKVTDIRKRRYLIIALVKIFVEMIVRN